MKVVPTDRRVEPVGGSPTPDERPFDLIFAVRVGALDGRHPEAGERALRRIATASTPAARLFIDGGNPLRELRIPRGR